MSRHKRIFWLVVGVMWVLGLWVGWWLTPDEARSGWSLPRDKEIIGFLDDGKTILVAGTVRVWKTNHTAKQYALHDYETGELKSSLPAIQREGTRPYEPYFVKGKDWLVEIVDLNDPVEGKTPELASQRISPHRITVYDAWTMKVIREFTLRTVTSRSIWGISPNHLALAIRAVNEKDEPGIQVFSLHAGELVGSVPRVEAATYVIDLSDDGRVGMIQETKLNTQCTLTVFETSSEKTLMKLGPRNFSGMVFGELSPSGSTVFDHLDGSAWDVRSGKKRFVWPRQHAIFMDEKQIVTLHEAQKGPWSLHFYDMATGQEMLERRLTLPIELLPLRIFFVKEAPFVAIGRQEIARELPGWLQWLHKVPALRALRVKPIEFVIVNLETKQIVYTGSQSLMMIAPDGKSFLTRDDGGWQRWDIPPSKAKLHLLTTWLVWTLAFWLIANRVGRLWKSSG